jgi:hypothetical protein
LSWREERPWLILVGGFLGAGKTSLLLAAGERLRARGLRVALLTNDQAAGSVDTATARQAGFATGEVAGACFCCAFSEFAATAVELASQGVDAILAEPVGSCTDIVATVVRPLLAEYAQRFRLAPFTVLVDAAQHRAMHATGADADVAWLYRQQCAEADLLVLSKCDEPMGAVPGFDAPLHRLSARTGAGVDAWLELVTAGRIAPGSQALAELDYARYATAEARLAWLNATAHWRSEQAVSPAVLAGPWFEELEARLSAAGLAIAHLKAWIETPGSWLRLSTTRNGAEPVVEGDRLAPSAREFQVVVNLRAQGEPAALEACVRAALDGVAAEVTVEQLDCFRPAPPKPERLLR